MKRVWLCVGVLGAAWLLPGQTPTVEGHPEDYPRADIEYGARLYAEQCSRCHAANGTGVSGVDLRSGKFRTASTDSQLRMVILNGFPSAGMPSFKLDPPDISGLIAYLRNMNTFDSAGVKIGSADRGKALFEGRGACLSCHRVNDKGSRKGPDLSSIGTARSAAYFERLLNDPNAQLLPINRAVHIVTTDGRTIDGRRLNLDTYTVQIVDAEGQLISLPRSEFRTFEISLKSGMPSYKGELTPEQMADVVAFLLSLKGR